MRKIIDILWKRDAEMPNLAAGQAAEAAFALLDAAETKEEETLAGLDSVQKLGQENESLRLLFIEAQRKVDDREFHRRSRRVGGPDSGAGRPVAHEPVDRFEVRERVGLGPFEGFESIHLGT